MDRVNHDFDPYLNMNIGQSRLSVVASSNSGELSTRQTSPILSASSLSPSTPEPQLETRPFFPSTSTTGSIASTIEHASESQIISQYFSPTSSLSLTPPDVIIISSDSVWFYVHRDVLESTSQNTFFQNAGWRNSKNLYPKRLCLSETSAVLTTVFLTMYKMSLPSSTLSFQSLLGAVRALFKYGVPPLSYLSSTSPLFAMLVAHASRHALELYVLASEQRVHALAAQVSQYLHSVALSSIGDKDAALIGGVYMAQLFDLHSKRIIAFKRLLAPGPHPHTPKRTCSEPHKLPAQWSFASAYLAWVVRADLSALIIEDIIAQSCDRLPCVYCKLSMRDAGLELIKKWENVEKTI